MIHFDTTHLSGSIPSISSAQVKLWDMVKEGCTHTFADHPQAVWSCAFHDEGDFLVPESGRAPAGLGTSW